MVSKIDLKVFSICLIIASFIWLVMTLSDDYNYEIDIPVKYYNYPEGMILTNDPVDFVTVEVNAQGFKLASTALYKRNAVKIDLGKIDFKKIENKGFTSSKSTADFRYMIMKQLNVDNVGDNFKPEIINFIFDSLITKRVPIKLNADIKYSAGYVKYKDPVFSPAFIEVSGPASTLNKVNYIETDSFSATDISSDIEADLKLKIPFDKVSLDEERVNMVLKTEKFSEFSVWAPVNIKSNIKDLSVKTFPSKVKITFSMALPDYKMLNDSSFAVQVRLDSIDLLQKDKLLLEIVKKPEGLETVNLSSESVEFVIQN